jgi:hypothetical protein
MQSISSFQETYSGRWKVSRYTILSYVYFFFNSILLPKGLLYTNILSPLFYYETIKRNRKVWFLPVASFMLVYDCIHLMQGVDVKSFIVSNGLFFSTYMCTVSFYHFINDYENIGRIMKHVLLFNAVLVVIAIPFLFAERPLQELFWYVRKFTAGVEDMPRLALFTYEASYYSLLLVPVVYYYVLKFLFNDFVTGKWFMLALALIPLLMSLSFGVIGATLIVAFLQAMFFSRKIFSTRRSLLLFGAVAVLLFTALALIWLLPGNPLLLRLRNVLSGSDTSANGRTFDSLRMAWHIGSEKSAWFGVGLGQVKFIAAEVVRTHFSYWGVFPRYDIPNAMGETIAIFGISGVIIRLGLQLWLFFRTRVYENHYRLALFLFIFIYQFTGSFITNIVEYVIWAIAFSSAFTRFNVTSPRT